MSLLDLFKKPKISRGGEEPDARVQVYDFVTKRVTMTPIADMPPGMVQASVDGVEGPCWVAASQLKASKYLQVPDDREPRGGMKRQRNPTESDST